MTYGRMSDTKRELGINADQTNPGDPRDAEKFSETVYKSGGNNRYRGRLWQSKGASSEEELEMLLDDGWCRTLPEALKQTPSEAETVQKEIAKIKAEKQLEQDMKELEELREWKAQKEAGSKETPVSKEFTPEELYSLYLENGNSWKKVTELTGVKSPHLRCQSQIAEAKG
jgi:hypothetical protein